jgi:hypothetical protein
MPQAAATFAMMTAAVSPGGPVYRADRLVAARVVVLSV